MDARKVWLAFCVLVFGLALPITVATGASFDCAKAETPFEMAICTSPELSEADEALADAYASALALVSPAAGEVVRDGQREWLAFAQRVCTEDAQMRTSPYDDEGRQCLVSVFRNRTETLARNRAVGDTVFFSLDRYGVVASTETDTWSKVASEEVSITQLDGGGAEARAFNATLRKMAYYALSPFETGNFDTTSDFETSYDVESATPQRISVIVTDYFYGHGAAHGNYAITYWHFLREGRRDLTSEDVFVGDDWALALKPIIIDVLKAQLGADGIWQDLEGLEDSIADASRWRISTDGIGFQFQPYEVTAYAGGAPVADLSWETLAPYLATGARELLSAD